MDNGNVSITDGSDGTGIGGGTTLLYTLFVRYL